MNSIQNITATMLACQPKSRSQRRSEINRRYYAANREIWTWYNQHIRKLRALKKILEGPPQ